MRRGRPAIVLLAAALLAAGPVLRAVAGDRDRTAEPDQATVQFERIAAATAERMDDAGTVDLPVRFTVQNVNRSKAACNTDGRTYQVNGHLTAPAELLERPDKLVTFYQHGIAAGEWYWRLDAPGYHHAEEMAKRGHASLTINRLGYDGSDTPNGLDMCIGGQADITHQIVQQLRNGGYQVDGLDRAPTFTTVVLAGHDIGGQIAQIASYSFADIDGLVIMGWADRGLTDEAYTRFFGALTACLQGGVPAENPDDPSGYAYFDVGSRPFVEGNFHDTEQMVLDIATPQQNRHPCGDMASQLEANTIDLQHLDEIDVPVLFVYGEHDARIRGGAAHEALFTGTDDTALLIVPHAGHYVGLARNAGQVHDALASWLDSLTRRS